MISRNYVIVTLCVTVNRNGTVGVQDEFYSMTNQRWNLKFLRPRPLPRLWNQSLQMFWDHDSSLENSKHETAFVVKEMKFHSHSCIPRVVYFQLMTVFDWDQWRTSIRITTTRWCGWLKLWTSGTLSSRRRLTNRRYSTTCRTHCTWWVYLHNHQW